VLVTRYDLELDQLDVNKTVFLHGNLDEIYMTQPVGFKAAGQKKLVCKLNKSLYELKQLPKLWYKRFDKYMCGKRYP